MNSALYPIKTFRPAVGPGGRSSRAGASVTVFGASGFLARYVVNRLGREGWTVRAATRGDDMSVRHLKPLLDLGRFVPHFFNAKDAASVAAAIPRGTDVVVNLVGKTYDTKHLLPWWVNNTLEDSHVRATQAIASAARRAGVKHFVQVSSAKADANSPSAWARTKAVSEKVASDEFPGATIVRLGQVYGEEDRFLNTWATALKRLPVVPLVDGGAAKLRPVFVGDVADGLGSVIGDWERFAGDTVDLLGPGEFTLRQVVEYVARTIDVETPRFVDASAQGVLGGVASLLEKLPNPVVTPDQLQLLRCSDVPKPGALTFDDLGLKPVAFEKKAYNYLFRYRPGGHFVELRQVEEAKGPVHVSHVLGQSNVETKTAV